MISSLLLLPLLTSLTSAARDNDYYYPGFVNPNTKYHMYWKDSVNVLEDLDQFESLYIKYHGCVWSKYGTMYGTGEDYDEQDGNNDNDGFENGCGGWQGGEYYWYMGRTQCFKANVAYSLYGVLKGDDPKMKHGSYCHAGTYINSFFTTFGVESFAGPMGLGTSTANSVCLNNQNGQAGNGDFSYAQVDDDYLSDDYEFYDSSTFTSQGTGCSAKGTFVTDTYSGPFCHGRDFDETIDTLDDFNALLQEMDCTEIYSASNNYNNNDKNRKLNNDNEGYDYDYEFENLPAYQILSFSKSCSVAQYPKDCPDPFGKKKLYAQNIQRALAYKTGRFRDMGTNIVKTVSWILFSGAILLLAGIYYLSQEDTKLSRKEERRLKRQQRKEKKQNRSNNNDDAVLERGIESTLSDTSLDDSKASKKSGRSCLGLPKIKLPKKLRRNNNNNAARDAGDLTDDDDDVSVETSLSEYQEYARQARQKKASQTDETSNGYITMDNLFDQAASFVDYATGFSSTDGNETEAVSAHREDRSAPSEWGTAPDDVSAASGHSGKMAGMATVAGVAAVAATAKSKIPSRLRAILPGSPSRRAKQQAENKEVEMVKAETKPQDKAVITPVASQEDDVLPNSFLDMSSDNPVEVEAEGNHPFLHDSFVDPDAAKPIDGDYEMFADEPEEEKTGPEDVATTDKAKKKGGFFRRKSSTGNKTDNNTSAPKSPISNLFSKKQKSLSPSQMATAPPAPVLTLAPNTKSQSKTKKGFFSKTFGKQKGGKAQINDVEDDVVVVEEPPVIPSMAKKPPTEEDEADSTPAKSKSFELTTMIDIIEPTIPPESQKDLFCATPPVSQKTMGSSGSRSPASSPSSAASSK